MLSSELPGLEMTKYGVRHKDEEILNYVLSDPTSRTQKQRAARPELPGWSSAATPSCIFIRVCNVFSFPFLAILPKQPQGNDRLKTTQTRAGLVVMSIVKSDKNL